MDKKIKLVKLYDYDEYTILVEMIINEIHDNIDFTKFYVPDDNFDESYWQAAYMVQYLNPDEIEATHYTCDVSGNPMKPARVVFFIQKSENPTLSTPYGDFPIENLQEVPDELMEIVEFDEFSDLYNAFSDGMIQLEGIPRKSTLCFEFVTAGIILIIGVVLLIRLVAEAQDGEEKYAFIIFAVFVAIAAYCALGGIKDVLKYKKYMKEHDEDK